jgi:hypothetical protein
MDPTEEAGPVFDKFFPASGTTFVEIQLTGAECPFAGVTAPVKGTATGEAEPATGELASPRTLRFDQAAQETGGGELKLGKGAAVLTATVEGTLSGANAGEPFGADE